MSAISGFCEKCNKFRKRYFPIVIDTKSQKIAPVVSITYDENHKPIEAEVISEGDIITLVQGEFEIADGQNL